MKIFEHLIKNSYAFLLAFCLIFLIGPKLINSSKEKKEIIEQDNLISKLNLDYLNQNVANYLTFETLVNNKTFKVSFKKGDNQYSNLTEFFQKYSKKNELDLPIIIPDSVISSINSSHIEIGNRGELIFLKVDNDVLIGKKRTNFGKAFLFVLGIIFIILGITFTILTVLAINNSIKIYKKTGKLPSLVNSVDEMIAGWRIILKKKK
ncbi:MAG: hypothetical protein N4A72_19270 [Bacteroidales bacterium]|jgi:hypothetical protein|nr:hypothetical protein [Bacteroidales bacterium]